MSLIINVKIGYLFNVGIQVLFPKLHGEECMNSGFNAYCWHKLGHVKDVNASSTFA